MGGGAAGAAGGRGGTAGGGGAAGAGGRAGAGGGMGAATGAGGSAGAGGGSACTVELLDNGNFDTGDNVWVSLTSDRPLIYDQSDVGAQLGPRPNTPRYMAWLGYDVRDETVMLAQPLRVPAGTLSLTISGWFQIWTDDDPEVVFDEAYIELKLGTFTQLVDSWSNVDRANIWKRFSQDIDVTPIAGLSPTFQLRVHMDDGANTSFFFDTLSVIANRCAP
jgi:hypothetical protein